MTATTLVVLALCSLFLFAGWFARGQIKRNLLYGKYAKEFFDRSKPLLDDPDTPIEVLSTLEFVNKMITRKSSARKIVVAMADRLNGREPSNKTLEKAAKMEEFLASRPTLDRAFTEALAAAVFAITSRSWFWGKVARVQFQRIVEDDHRTAAPVVRRFAKSVKRSQKTDRTDNDQTVPA